MSTKILLKMKRLYDNLFLIEKLNFILKYDTMKTSHMFLLFVFKELHKVNHQILNIKLYF